MTWLFGALDALRVKRFFDFGAVQADARASEEGVRLGATRAKVLDWLALARKVSSREIKSD